jgi:Rod binding domain-containing protein
MPVDPLLSGVLSTGLGMDTSITAPSITAKDSPEKIRAAASQFEALLISQVLKASHEDGEEGWLGTGEDQTAGSMMGMAEDYFARAMAKGGGFGLAKMISAGLEHRASADSATRSTPPTSPSAAETPRTSD